MTDQSTSSCCVIHHPGENDMSEQMPMTHMSSHAESDIDPVCGMKVDPATAAGHHEYQAKTCYFCAVSCLDTFKADPERFLKPAPAGLISLGKRKPLPMMMPAAKQKPDMAAKLMLALFIARTQGRFIVPGGSAGIIAVKRLLIMHS